MAEDEPNYYSEEETAENMRELADMMEEDSTHLRQVASDLENGILTVAEADEKGKFDLQIDERI